MNAAAVGLGVTDAPELRNSTPFPPLRYAELHVTLCADGDFTLPAFKGTAIHGLLGRSLFSSLCRFQGDPFCAGCWLRPSCGYGLLFGEPMPETPPKGLKGVATPPRPYVVACPDDREQYTRGQLLSFTIRLFGRASELQGSVVLALEKYADEAFQLQAREREVVVDIAPGAFALVAINRVLHDGESESLLGEMSPNRVFHNVVHTNAPVVLENDGLRIRFLTPVDFGSRAERNNWLYEAVLSIMRRAHHLAAIYDGWDEHGSSFSPLLRLAESTTVVEVSNVKENYYRARNDGARAAPVGGNRIVLDVQNCPHALLEVLAWGTILHVGHNSSCGLGQFILEPLDQCPTS